MTLYEDLKSPITLYHYWRSSSSWRVRWALLLKGVAFEKKHIHLVRGEQKKSEYLSVNPAGLVPCLVKDGRALSESLAIIEWLDETYPDPPLLPKDPWQRAQSRELALIIAAGIQPLGNLRALSRHSDQQEEREAWHRYFIETGLSLFETKIQQWSGPFCMGQDLSIADICLIPQIYNALRNRVDMKKYPRCWAIYEHCLTTPACAAASPAQQAEAE